MSANGDSSEQSLNRSTVYNEGELALDVNSAAYEDDDICSLEELNKLFKCKYKIHDKIDVTDDSSYVLSLAKDDSLTSVAAGLSNSSVRVFEINSEKGIYIEPPATNLNICGVRFVDETPNLLLVGTSNGLVRLLDLRTRLEVSRFVNNAEYKFFPTEILSFDRNSTSLLLAMGTVLKNSNVSLLVYDLRSSNKLLTYYESHQDDITTLRFHPKDPDLLCSGSSDGLINVYDVKMNNDDDAILTTINTETTVNKVNWHKNDTGQNIISCITDFNGFKIYEFDASVIADFDRVKITETIKRQNESNCNLIDCHSMADNGLLLLSGAVFNNGSILRACKFQRNELKPYANFGDNKEIVRASVFDSKTKLLITGGESGSVTMWTPLEWESAASSKSTTDLKMITKKSNKFRPY